MSITAEEKTKILNEYKIQTRLTFTTETSDPAIWRPVIVTVGHLSGGFELPQSGLIVHVEADVFDETADSADRRASAQAASRRS